MAWTSSRREFVIASGLSIAGLFLPKGVSADNPPNASSDASPEQPEPIQPLLPEVMPKILIKTYHLVNSDSLIDDYQYCRNRGLQQIGLEDLGRFVLGKASLPEFCFMDTFDDGFVDQKPAILEARKYIKAQLHEEYQATVFIITQFEHPDRPVEELPPTTLTYREKEPWEYKQGEMPRHLTIGETIELGQEGEGFVRFGSHTMNHANLTLLSDNDRLQEIFEGKRRTDFLCQQAGVESEYSALAYPLWGQNAQIRQEVAAAGYTMAFGAMLDPDLQKIMEPVIQTPNMRFFLQRMSRS